MDGNAMTTAPKVVNGINLDDLFSLIESVRLDPAKGVTRWHVATTWQGQTGSRSQVEGFGIGGEEVKRRFMIDIDEPCELGGSNRFANPQEYLIAALNACMTVGYAAQCAVRGIALESLVIETEGEIDLRGFLGIDPTVAKGYEHHQHDDGESDENGRPTSPAPQQHRCPPFRDRSSAVRTPCGTARRAPATARSAPWRSPQLLVDRT